MNSSDGHNFYISRLFTSHGVITETSKPVVQNFLVLFFYAAVAI